MELKSRLEEMADLEGELRLLREQLKQCEADHKIYLENKALADEFESRAEELDRETRRLEEKQRERDELVSSLATLKSLYDEAQYESAKRDWEESIREEAMLGNDLKRLRERAEDLGRQIEALRESEQQLESLRASKGRLESLDQLSKFVCELLKQAGPYIAESIVRSISVEANRLYRDITGNQNVTLHWSYENEYEIVLEEDGYERGFANLSGGEQMAAALSVRLALLKELSDLRIAFFDEPTANLDEQRRRQLAEEIGRITDFDQLFIISHDDAFESFTHQVVRVPNRSDISLEGWQGSAD
jgi:exonuclease SbcC